VDPPGSTSEYCGCWRRADPPDKTCQPQLATPPRRSRCSSTGTIIPGIDSSVRGEFGGRPGITTPGASGDKTKMDQVEHLDGITVLRGGGSRRSWNGINYQQGLSAKNSGAQALSINVATVPPGGIAYAHIHDGFEVMLFIVEGRVRHAYGEAPPPTSGTGSFRTPRSTGRKTEPDAAGDPSCGSWWWRRWLRYRLRRQCPPRRSELVANHVNARCQRCFEPLLPVIAAEGPIRPSANAKFSRAGKCCRPRNCRQIVCQLPVRT